ncbi:cell division protein FtsL [Virgibacillus xinjiangensis]|uniref:Cell division protein FtsL n=1 Tax=Virgibacillus xinjiangensis TaxID=393090 RepID=A0ABV7CV97_9BACI
MSANHARSWQQMEPQHTPDHKQKVNVKVRKQGWVTKGEKVLYSMMSACLVGAGVFVVSFSSSTDTLNREVQSLEQTVQQQKAENESLVFEVKELSRPERITSIAKENGLKVQDAQVKQAEGFSN